VWRNELPNHSPNTEAAILARLIPIGQEELPRGAAEYLLSIRLRERNIAHMNELSELARLGKLNGDEQAELDRCEISNRKSFSIGSNDFSFTYDLCRSNCN
jgi:hypothetical protein